MGMLLSGSDGYAWQDAQGRCGLVVHSEDGTTCRYFMIDSEWFTEDGKSINGEYVELLNVTYVMIANALPANFCELGLLSS